MMPKSAKLKQRNKENWKQTEKKKDSTSKKKKKENENNHNPKKALANSPFQPGPNNPLGTMLLNQKKDLSQSKQRNQPKSLLLLLRKLFKKSLKKSLQPQSKSKNQSRKKWTPTILVVPLVKEEVPSLLSPLIALK